MSKNTKRFIFVTNLLDGIMVMTSIQSQIEGTLMKLTFTNYLKTKMYVSASELIANFL